MQFLGKQLEMKTGRGKWSGEDLPPVPEARKDAKPFNISNSWTFIDRDIAAKPFVFYGHFQLFAYRRHRVEPPELDPPMSVDDGLSVSH